tara:strand:- start:2427 stop:4400 length:1974 start_codon:yes stop_codon:yes gene_type:complete
MSERAPIVDQDEVEWIQELTRFPAAKPLVQHASAFESIVKSGGQKGIEPPIDQASTWRRMFCWELQRSDAPFGIASSTGKLPKCIAICNLSGHHSFYYSDSFNLGKILCIAAQRVQSHVIEGVMSVFRKAQETGASVLVCFCLPFQVGIERCYWEARTIRKTSKGVVKDGEMCFTINDIDARVVSCTLASEHWPDQMFKELVKKMLRMVSPVSLDFSKSTDTEMSLEKLQVAVRILKTDRKHIMELHKRELELTKESAKAKLEEQTLRASLADDEASKRVAEVVSARDASEATLNKEMYQLQKDNAALLAKNATLQERMHELLPRLSGMKLERETELSKATARQKALQAQVSQMQSSHAKQVAEHSKHQQTLKKSHQTAIESSEAQIKDLKRQLNVATTTAAAVGAGAKEAHEAIKRMEGTAARTTLSTRVCVALLLDRAGKRAKRILSLEQSVAKEKELADARVDAVQKEVASRDAQIEKLSEVAATESKETEMREMNEKTHLISEMQKRTTMLEGKLEESDAEVLKLKAATTVAQQPNAKKRTGDDSRSNGVHHNGGQQQLNISQNTAVFMGQPPHTHPHHQAFPQGQFVVDPALEGMVSQLHSALNCITAMARSSSTHKRAAEVAHGKLDALSSQAYYEPAYCAPSQQFYPNGC